MPSPTEKRHAYALRLAAASYVEEVLRADSGLPGPRANLELAQAAADVLDAATLRRLAGSDDEYLALCGAVGLGRLVAAGDRSHLNRLGELASDPRWRVREGVAMGLQRLGAADMAALLAGPKRTYAGECTSPQRDKRRSAGGCTPAGNFLGEATRRGRPWA
ncbi:MAG: hypothetical protein M3024_06335 [Candidatus Dormibacteraeota bacterium]|nr:hypothetical protein [Candidatus Dormibacteraeota bacterium]